MKNNSIYNFASFLNGSQTLKGKNLLPQEQIHFFNNRPHFRRGSSSRKAHRKSQKLFLLVKMRKTWMLFILKYQNIKVLVLGQA